MLPIEKKLPIIYVRNLCKQFEVLIYMLFVPHFPNKCVSRIGSSPYAFSSQDSKVYITLVWPKYQPQPRSFKLVTLIINDQLCSRSSPRVRQKAITHFNEHDNLGRDIKLWALKVHPRLREFMSLLSHNRCVVMHGRCCPSLCAQTLISRERHL